MAHHGVPAGADLLKEVEKLAGEGYAKGEIAERLGFKNPTTFEGRLVKASQRTGRPVPAFAARAKAGRKRVDVVQVKPRGQGQSFGVNIPQEPLARLGVKPGDRLSVAVSHQRIVLSVAGREQPSERAPRAPRLIKRRGRPSGDDGRGRATG